MCVKFGLSSSSSFRDMRGPKFTLGGAAPPARRLAKKSLPKSALGLIRMCVKFQLSISSSFRDMGVQIYTAGTSPPSRPQRKNFQG